jgi:hypothetical protein
MIKQRDKVMLEKQALNNLKNHLKFGFIVLKETLRVGLGLIKLSIICLVLGLLLGSCALLF